MFQEDWVSLVAVVGLSACFVIVWWMGRRS